MSCVFVVDANRVQLYPVHAAHAHKLLSTGKAVVLKRYPFTIMLKKVAECVRVAHLRLKIDPGSKITGLALVNDETGEVLWAAELSHRSQAVVSALEERARFRRFRRNRHTRYRKERFYNRAASRRKGTNSRRKGIKQPSMQSRVSNTVTWVSRLCRLCPISALSVEDVKFDTQRMENAEISGVEYQQGTLLGYDVQGYLLEKWNRSCAYCGAKDVPLQVEHIYPRSRGGSSRISNLCMACEQCNKAKGNRDVKEFLSKKPELLRKILAQTKTPLRDAAAVNSTRKELKKLLHSFGMPLETGTGSLTKYNRHVRNIDKTHWLDAACVGESTPACLLYADVHPLYISATGYGNRHMAHRTDAYGFRVRVGDDARAEHPDGKLSGRRKHDVAKPELWKQKMVGGKLVERPRRRVGPDTRPFARARKSQMTAHGFRTGDIVKAVIGKNVVIGRAVKASEKSLYFRLPNKKTVSFQDTHCVAVHRKDGYMYSFLP